MLSNLSIQTGNLCTQFKNRFETRRGLRAYLDPVEGSEQRATRPAIIVSRDAINEASPVVLAVPSTRYRQQRIYPSQVLLRAAEGGLDLDSVAMAEQVRAIDQRRLGRLRGTLSEVVSRRLDRALLIALDLPGQT